MKEELSHLANLISLIYEDGKLDKKNSDCSAISLIIMILRKKKLIIP